MVVCENDKLLIPKKYKEMSIPEIDMEKKKVLKEFRSQLRPKKRISTNKNGILFNF